MTSYLRPQHFHSVLLAVWLLHGSKENSMLVKRIAACTIYLQTFTSYREILVGNCNFFLPLAFNAPVGGVSIGIPGKVWSSEN